MLRKLALTILFLGLLPVGPSAADAENWISEAEMKQRSVLARQQQLMLVGLNCKFQEGVESPGRQHVLFKADFQQVSTPLPWGWTFDANAELPGPENQARAAGFEVASEDYYEISGITWVRCRVWHRP